MPWHWVGKFLGNSSGAYPIILWLPVGGSMMCVTVAYACVHTVYVHAWVIIK